MLITNKCQLRCHQKWTSYYTKLNHIKHNTDNWTFPIKIHRKFEVILTKLRIGHTQISHSFLMAKKNPQNAHPAVSKSTSATSSLNAEYTTISEQTTTYPNH